MDTAVHSIGLQVFFLALALPGFALLRRVDPEALQDGALRAIAYSYLATCVLLTPISVLGYVLRLPITVLSWAVVLSVLAAVVALVRQRPKVPRPSWRDAFVVVPVLLLVADMVLGARAGSHMHGDAGYHVARVRSLVDTGFNSWDPTLPGRHFDSAYHTNLYHALLASGAQLTGAHAIDAWLQALPVAKLLTVASAYTLAQAVFGQRALSWLSACVAVWYFAPHGVRPYPNTLAASWLSAVALACGVEILTQAQRGRAVARLAACLLVVAQFHMLYAVLLGLLLGPPFGALLLKALVRREPGRRMLVLALLSFGVAGPWLLPNAAPKLSSLLAGTTSHGRNAPAATAPQPTAAGVVNERGAPDLHFVTLADGKVMRNPAGFLGTSSTFLHFAIVLGAGLFSSRRRQCVAVGAIGAVAFLSLFVPVLCTMLIRLLGAGWILLRLEALLTTTWIAIFPFGLAVHLLERWRHPPLAVALQAAALAYGYDQGIDSKTFSRTDYLARAMRFSAAATSRRHTRERAAFVRVPKGATVLTGAGMEYTLPTYCDCRVLATGVGRGSRGLADMAERREALQRFLSDEAGRNEKIRILRKYGVRHMLVYGRDSARSWAKIFGRRVRHVDRGRHMRVLTVDTR